MYESPQIPGAESLDYFDQYYRYGYMLLRGPDGRPLVDRYGNLIQAPYVIGMTGTTGPDRAEPMPIEEAEALGAALGAPVEWDGVDTDGDGYVDRFNILTANEDGAVTAGRSYYPDHVNVSRIVLSRQPSDYEQRQSGVHEVAHAIFDVIEDDPAFASVLQELDPALEAAWRLFNDGDPEDFGYAGYSRREGLADFMRLYDDNAAWMSENFGGPVDTLMWLINTHPEIARHVQMI